MMRGGADPRLGEETDVRIVLHADGEPDRAREIPGRPGIPGGAAGSARNGGTPRSESTSPAIPSPTPRSGVFAPRARTRVGRRGRASGHGRRECRPSTRSLARCGAEPRGGRACGVRPRRCRRERIARRRSFRNSRVARERSTLAARDLTRALADATRVSRAVRRPRSGAWDSDRGLVDSERGVLHSSPNLSRSGIPGRQGSRAARSGSRPRGERWRTSVSSPRRGSAPPRIMRPWSSSRWEPGRRGAPRRRPPPSRDAGLPAGGHMVLDPRPPAPAERADASRLPREAVRFPPGRVRGRKFRG